MKNRIFSTGNFKFTGNIGLLLIRLVSGGIMHARHGHDELQKLFAGPPYDFRDPIGLGVEVSFFMTLFAEIICTIFVVIGLGTRLAVIPLIITMSVVAFVVHVKDGFFAMELPIMYLTMYLTLLLMGPGKYSVDRLIEKKLR